MSSAATSAQALSGALLEQLRQRELLQALHSAAAELPPGWCARPGPDAQATPRQGLLAYQRNTQAVAERCLQGAYPVVAELVGPEGLSALARGLWLQQPPRLGDLGLWGADLAALIDSRPELADTPYLADVARLEWQMHLAARAADTAPGVQGLQQLASCDPAALHLVLVPGSALLVSRWPVVQIWQAHPQTNQHSNQHPNQAPQQPPGRHPHQHPDPHWHPHAESGDRASALAAAGQALARGEGETAWVWRQGWRVCLQALPAAWGDFHADLLAGQSLAQALAGQSAPEMFGPWLQQALSQAWLSAVRHAA